MGEETTHGSAVLTGKITGEHHPFVEHFKFVQALEEPGHTTKQTIPAPAQLLLELYRDEAAADARAASIRTRTSCSRTSARHTAP